MRFSDLGITIETNNYTDPKISINDILNIEIDVLEFKKNVKTKNGDRYLVKFKIDNEIRVFFTSSSHIIQVLEHPNVKFPFTTTIKSYKVGDKRGYNFT